MKSAGVLLLRCCCLISIIGAQIELSVQTDTSHYAVDGEVEITITAYNPGDTLVYMIWPDMPAAAYFLGPATNLFFTDYIWGSDFLYLTAHSSFDWTITYPSDWLHLEAGVHAVVGYLTDPHFQITPPVFITAGPAIPQYPLTGFYPLADSMMVTNGCSPIFLTATRVDDNEFLQRIVIQLEEYTEMILNRIHGGQVSLWPLLADKLYFYIADSSNQYDFELFWETQSGLIYPIPFDEVFSIADNGNSRMNLVLFLNNIPVDTVTHAFTSSTGLATKDDTYKPEQFEISCYPNPFNPTTTIQYELPHRSDVQITIYDLQGREVTTLVSEKQDAGYNSVQWDATNVSSGMYFYQIRAGEFVQTRKMVVLK